MFTTRMPKIFQFLEYVIVLAAVVVIWQVVVAHPTSAQDDEEQDNFRSLIVDLNEQALETGHPTFSMTVDPQLFERTRIIPTEDNISIIAIGDDYICLEEEWDTTLTRNYCVPLSVIQIISIFAG